MKTLSEFRPTGFEDSPAKFFDEDDERRDWLMAPVSRTRDTGPFEESNFESALKILGGESENVEVHRFGHWGPGWFEIIICKPTEANVKILTDIEAGLEDYPIIDDEDYSRRELECAEESWRSYGHSDYIRNLLNMCRDELLDGPYYDQESECLSEEGDAILESVEEYLDDVSHDVAFQVHMNEENDPYHIESCGAHFNFGYMKDLEGMLSEIIIGKTREDEENKEELCQTSTNQE